VVEEGGEQRGMAGDGGKKTENNRRWRKTAGDGIGRHRTAGDGGGQSFTQMCGESFRKN